MYVAKMEEYTVKKGQYRKRELSLLATSLGFPGTLLVSQFESYYTTNNEAENGRVVSEKTITRLLSSGALFKKLEKVFNKYPAWYNVKLIRKAMQHIRHRSLSFRDISQARIAFELYSCEDGSGMAAELLHVQRALKMLERVMSPSQLQLEIQRFNEVSDVPSRLQLYEFMDIVALCGKTEVEDERRLSEINLCDGTTSAASSQELSVADFDQILMTRDQKVTVYLENSYQYKLHGRQKKDTSSKETQSTNDDQIIHTDSRKSLVSLAAEQSRAVTPCLERSQSQLNRSRCGFYTLSSEHFKSMLYSSQSSCRQSPIHTKPHKTLTRHRSKLTTVDPLQSQTKEGSMTHHNHVRVNLKHHPMRKPLTLHTPLHDTEFDKQRDDGVGIAIGKEINDICADSVIKARETLHSSMSISPLNNTLPEPSSTAVVDAHRSASVAAIDRAHRSGPRLVNETEKKSKHLCSVAAGGYQGSCFYLEPIVTQKEKNEQQFLIDNLLWSTRRSKKHYQIIERK